MRVFDAGYLPMDTRGHGGRHPCQALKKTLWGSYWLQLDLTGTTSDKAIIAGDINGDADFWIELTGLKTLTVGDLFLQGRGTPYREL
jgi:hypothetical protein